MRLDPAQHAWIIDPRAQRVMTALNDVRPDCVRFVGGCVRNALRGAPIKDLDLATQLTPQASLAALQAADIKVIPTGMEHGTLTAIVEGEPFEVTSLRRDVATDGRRAVVAFTQDWAEDAARRDFYLNALYVDGTGQLYDPLGGYEDALAGRIRFIGDAETRIREDYLRIFRFYRFQACYGEGDLDRVGQAACTALAGGVKTLSRERIWSEVKALLSAPDPLLALKGVERSTILEQVLTQGLDFNALFGIIKRESDVGLSPDPLVRLAALVRGRCLRTHWDAVSAINQAFRPSKTEEARLSAALTPPSWDWGGESASIRAAAYREGAEAVSDQMRLAVLDHDQADTPWMMRALHDLEHWLKPGLPVTGGDLIALGVAPGPQLGEILAALEAQWIASDFTLTRDRLLNRVRDMRQTEGEGDDERH
ncbi:CCA tRNA nucleotidyltransferase [Woodsholea maritima]|uniref:CCA tRNA nucleotidyltransferase n=1 Tax=Woodsholea maritima TaxID=240237 RepID=UPI00037310BD|nr:CCA tRNA nucleotidyltransferase [Woodsholea maritima]